MHKYIIVFDSRIQYLTIVHNDELGVEYYRVFVGAKFISIMDAQQYLLSTFDKLFIDPKWLSFEDMQIASVIKKKLPFPIY